MAINRPSIEGEAAKRSDAIQIFSDVAKVRFCSNPINLKSNVVDLATGELRSSSYRVACKDRRELICPACSHLYKADAWILVAAGLAGGKGIPASVASHPRVFLTLTAPSFGPVHSSRSDGSCVSPTTSGLCHHGTPKVCLAHHAAGDPLLGAPICGRCHDDAGAVAWNFDSSALWNRTMVRFRQRLGARGGLTEPEFREAATISYLKVAELQRRGLAHFHVVIRIDGSQGPESPPPSWIDAAAVIEVLSGLVPEVAIELDVGSSLRWGSQFDIHELSNDVDDVLRIASYVAKYSTKSTVGSEHLSRAFSSRAEVCRAEMSEHQRRLVLAAWDLERARRGPAAKVRFAHTFGYRGHLITKSRHYSTSFSTLRSARAIHMVQRAIDESTVFDPILEGTTRYVGRGYDDPRSEQIADHLHAQVIEFQRERAQARRDLDDHLATEADRCESMGEDYPSTDETSEEESK